MLTLAGCVSLCLMGLVLFPPPVAAAPPPPDKRELARLGRLSFELRRRAAQMRRLLREAVSVVGPERLKLLGSHRLMSPVRRKSLEALLRRMRGMSDEQWAAYGDDATAQLVRLLGTTVWLDEPLTPEESALLSLLLQPGGVDELRRPARAGAPGRQVPHRAVAPANGDASSRRSAGRSARRPADDGGTPGLRRLIQGRGGFPGRSVPGSMPGSSGEYRRNSGRVGANRRGTLTPLAPPPPRPVGTGPGKPQGGPGPRLDGSTGASPPAPAGSSLRPGSGRGKASPGPAAPSNPGPWWGSEGAWPVIEPDLNPAAT